MNKPDLRLSRRDALAALAGAMVSSAPGQAQGPPRKTVGIVGGGMAGTALAWLLDGERDVVLFEARQSLGGNVQTVTLDVGGRIVAADVGAQYFHPNLYRVYVRLLTILGLYPPLLGQTRSFPASISVFNSAEPLPRFVSPVFWDRLWPIIAPWNWEGLGAFATGFAASKIREDQNADWNVTLESWLQTLSLNERQWRGMLLPWAASLFTGRTEQARGLSARAAMIFAATAVPPNSTDPVVSFVVDRGMAEPIKRMASQMRTVEIVLSAGVDRVTQLPGNRFLLVCRDGRRRQVDELVLACSGPATERLLEGLPANRSQQIALSGIEFEDTRIALHTDPTYAPPDPNHWSFLNCQIHDSFCEASMWLTKVLPPSSFGAPELKLWKSWVTHRQKQPANVLHESRFQHMVPTVGTLRAQIRLLDLQGHDGVWIAGGYTYPFDSQETAVLSALRIASGMKAISVRGRLLAAP